jgi:hypothetical protein
MIPQLLIGAGRHAPGMVAEFLAVFARGRKAIDFPGLAHLAAGPGIARSAAFVMHGS